MQVKYVQYHLPMAERGWPYDQQAKIQTMIIIQTSYIDIVQYGVCKGGSEFTFLMSERLRAVPIMIDDLKSNK